MSNDTHFIWNLAEDERIIRVVLWPLVTTRGLKHVRSANRAMEANPLDITPEGLRIIATSSGVANNGADVLYESEDDELAFVHLSHGSGILQVWGKTSESTDQLFQLLDKYFPQIELPDTSDEVSINFWLFTNNGPQNISRRITVPAWDDVESNYPDPTKSELESLVRKTEWRPESGQLVLWTGTPGTGKTFALRALAREWRKWCDIHYITDPESFFGKHADYMMSVILHNRDEYGAPKRSTDKWKLLVLEDAGELLAADAKQQVGQALSRLLNIVDGLIGQGLQLLVLVTTNEEIKRLHPAVARPGRCAQKIDFQAFTREDAAEWISAKDGNPDEIDASTWTLANMYAQLEGRLPASKQKAGFFSANNR